MTTKKSAAGAGDPKSLRTGTSKMTPRFRPESFRPPAATRCARRDRRLFCRGRCWQTARERSRPTPRDRRPPAPTPCRYAARRRTPETTGWSGRYCSIAERRNQNRVAEARDREELADALQKREDQRLKERHRAALSRRLPPPSPRDELDAEVIGRRNRFAVVQRRRVARVARHRHGDQVERRVSGALRHARPDDAPRGIELARAPARFRWCRRHARRARCPAARASLLRRLGVGRGQPEAGVALGAASPPRRGRASPDPTRRGRLRGRCSRTALPSSAAPSRACAADAAEAGASASSSSQSRPDDARSRRPRPGFARSE